MPLRVKTLKKAKQWHQAGKINHLIRSCIELPTARVVTSRSYDYLLATPKSGYHRDTGSHFCNQVILQKDEDELVKLSKCLTKLRWWHFWRTSWSARPPHKTFRNQIKPKTTLCLKKRPTYTTSYNVYIHSSIATIFGKNVAKKVGNQNVLYFPTTPN